MSDAGDQVWLSKVQAGKRLAEIREGVLGMTQQQLGEAIGYAEGAAQNQIANMETGARRIPEARLVRICRLAGVPITDFMVPGVVDVVPPGKRGEKLIVARYLEEYAGQLRREATSNDGGDPPGGSGTKEPPPDPEGDKAG